MADIAAGKAGRPPKFSDAEELREKIEEYTEERLYDRDGFNGARFNLINNFRGRSDKASSEDCDEAVIEKQENMLYAVKEAINGGN